MLGSFDSSPNPWVSFFFLQRGADSVHLQWDRKTAQSPGPDPELSGHSASATALRLTSCVVSGRSTPLYGPPPALPITARQQPTTRWRGWSLGPG